MVQLPSPLTDMDMGIKIKDKIRHHFFGEKRDSILKKNIILSVIFKILSVAISLLLVPVAIGFVDTTDFGIWLVLSSLVAWFSIFDIGITNGLRNKLAKALALRETELAKVYVSTVYIVLFTVFTFAWLLFLFINEYIDWIYILNIPTQYVDTIRKVTIIVFTYFYLFFLLKIINTILLADQKAAYSSLIDLVSQLGVLVTIVAMSYFLDGSLLYLFIGMCTAPVIVAVIFNIIFFRRRYRFLAPSFKFFRKWAIKDLMGLSFKFFIVQIAALIQYQTANIIIAHFFNMQEVTNYNIAYKYFSVLSIFFLMALHPLWSAATQAYHQGEYEWIKSTTKKYIKLFFIFVACGLVMLIASHFVYDIWIGKDIVFIPFVLSLCCLLYFSVNMFGSIFVNILNGIGAIRLQFVFSLFTPVIYIGLCLLFIKQFHLGIYSVFLAAIVSNVNGFIVAPIQYMKIFVQNKKGIWVK
ncbi:MAG: oligosaccharide flippase family protein [Dysgonomonas sp.]|nr:oligosaccharide flippase family protein [Dysgonomonas sp.]